MEARPQRRRRRLVAARPAMVERGRGSSEAAVRPLGRGGLVWPRQRRSEVEAARRPGQLDVRPVE